MPSTAGAPVTFYRYDDLGRVTGVTLEDGSGATYGYDAWGRKVRRTETLWETKGAQGNAWGLQKEPGRKTPQGNAWGVKKEPGEKAAPATTDKGKNGGKESGAQTGAEKNCV